MEIWIFYEIPLNRIQRGQRRRKAIKIYTGTGDYGKTSLFSGERVRKSDERVEAYGDVDELNSFLGVLGALLPKEASESQTEVERIQSSLFQLGALLATTPDSPSFSSLDVIGEEEIKFLENAIDRMENELSELRGFILPGGHASAACAHVARAVCRRAERHMVRLFSEGSSENPTQKLQGALVYVNRLSDYLFVLARYCNRITGVGDKIWGK